MHNDNTSPTLDPARLQALKLDELLAKLLRYADDIEDEGRTYAPAIMREAARRLRVDQPAPTETAQTCSCGFVGTGHVLPSGKCPAAPQGAPQLRQCRCHYDAFSTGVCRASRANGVVK